MKKYIYKPFIIIIIIQLFTITAYADSGMPEEGFGVLSLIPPLLAIVLSFVTKQVILSLFIGVFSGALMLYDFNPFIAFLRTLDVYIIGNAGDTWNAGILIFSLTIGGMIGIITKMGGTKAIADAMAKKATNASKAQLVTALMGLFVFFDDYANTLIVGPTMRPLTDRMKISREKLAYIIDSTAAPVAGIALISTWIGFQLGIIDDVFSNMGISANSYMVFVRTIPYSFYCILCFYIVLVIAKTNKDYGPMYDAEKRARLEGKLLADGANPMATTDDMESFKGKAQISNALIPIITLIVATFLGFWYNGYVEADGAISWFNIRDAFGYSDPSAVLVWTAVLGSIVAGILALLRKIMTMTEVMDAWLDGCKALFVTVFVLVLSWSIGNVVNDVGTADFIISAVSDSIPMFLIPPIIFSVSCLFSFATGSSWGTMAIVIPLAIPLASVYTPLDPTSSPIVVATLGAVLSGAIFGDHCSPISDTTIISSMGAASDHIDHVKTQLPYACTAAGFAVVCYAIVGLFTNLVGITIALLFGIVGIWIFVNRYGKTTDIQQLSLDSELTSD